jgi:hypothetical protein
LTTEGPIRVMMVTQPMKKEAIMTAFTITKDSPRFEIEFDTRFSNPDACYQYLSQLKWANGSVCRKCGQQRYWLSSRNLYICNQCKPQYSMKSQK